MSTQVVMDHLELAKDFLGRSKEYFERGDLHQASEKGWGAGSHIIKAVGAANNWPYESHDDFEFVVMNARQGYRRPGLLELSRAAEALHRNYYKRKQLLNADLIHEDIRRVERMIDILEPFVLGET